MKRTILGLVTTALALAFAPIVALAQPTLSPPGQISYQGFLTDANGGILASNTPKNYNILFRIYNTSTGATNAGVVWGEQQVVTVDRGYFTVMLGAGSPISGAFSTNNLSSIFATSDASDRYIGITVQGLSTNDVEISPRLRLLASPYSFLAANAVNVVGSNTVTAANLAPNIGVWTTSGNDVYRPSGKVGIGIANPSQPLDVGGNMQVKANGTVEVPGGGNTYSGLIEHSYNGTTDRYGMGELPGGITALYTSSLYSGSSIQFGQITGASSFSPQMTLFNNGNAAIGTTANEATLALGNINNGTCLELCKPSSSIGYQFYMDSSGMSICEHNVACDRFRIQNSTGNIGIGVGTPAYKLDVAGNGQFTGGTQIGTVNQGFYGDTANIAIRAYNSSSSDIYFQTYGGNATRMIMKNNGYIGIGTTSPAVPLDVEAFAYVAGLSGGWLFNSGATGAYNNFNEYVSIKAQYYVEAFGFVAVSDRRIKDIVGLSDTQKDLAQIEKLRVTDYEMKERPVGGHKINKGFIAQEVREVVPEAVHQSTNFIPSVFADSKSFSYDQTAQTLSVTMDKDHGLKKGDMVRVVVGDSKIEEQVTDIADDKTFTIGNVRSEPKHAFVYGKRVDDFLSVDYNRIFTTGIGAIQELNKRVEKLESREAHLAELEQKADKLDALEKEMADLRKMFAQLSDETKALKQTASRSHIRSASAETASGANHVGNVTEAAQILAVDSKQNNLN